MSYYVLAIDPGNVQSAYVLVNKKTLKPVRTGIIPNENLLRLLNLSLEKKETDVVIEMVASYGMAVGETVFETVFWIGRFYQAAQGFNSLHRIKRIDIKNHICHSSRAKDANIRQALIDRFGVVGTKKNPGWFYGFKADIWAAYAVAVTFCDKANL